MSQLDETETVVDLESDLSDIEEKDYITNLESSDGDETEDDMLDVWENKVNLEDDDDDDDGDDDGDDDDDDKDYVLSGGSEPVCIEKADPQKTGKGKILSCQQSEVSSN